MEKSLQTISAKGASAPPGFHAHLGMLYSIVGKSDQMVAQFEDEKTVPGIDAYGLPAGESKEG
jgi:hypothetical protein